METIRQSKTIFIEKIEDFLGSKVSRYSSNGYKNVKFTLTNFHLSPNSITNDVIVTWPLNWSLKSSNTVKPHLGTIEYFAIAAIMSELLLSVTYNLTEEEISKAWIREFKFKARANAATEHAAHTVVTCLKNTTAVTNSINGFVSCIEIRINEMEITLYVDHNGKENYNSFPHAKFSSLLNRINNNYYNVGYKKQEHDIRDITLTPEQKAITANISISKTQGSHKFNGLGNFFNPEMVITDFILTACQVSQVLIYMLDNLNRNNTNNLWLREINITYPKPLNNELLKLSLYCKEFKCLSMKNDTWRIAEVITKLGNIECTAKLAHILPTQITI